MSDRITFKSISAPPSGEGLPLRVPREEQPDMPAELNVSLPKKIWAIFHAIRIVLQGKNYFITLVNRLAEEKMINADQEKKIAALVKETACLKDLPALRQELDGFRKREENIEELENKAAAKERELDRREKAVKTNETALREKERTLNEKDDLLASREESLLQRTEKMRQFGTELKTREDALKTARADLNENRKKMIAEQKRMERAQEKIEADIEKAGSDLERLNSDIRFARHLRDNIVSEIPRTIDRIRQEIHSRQLERLPHEAETTIQLILDDLEGNLAEQLRAGQKVPAAPDKKEGSGKTRKTRPRV